MVERKEAIIKVVIDFYPEIAPFSDFGDIAVMMAEFIEKDFILKGVNIRSSKAFVLED